MTEPVKIARYAAPTLLNVTLMAWGVRPSDEDASPRVKDDRSRGGDDDGAKDQAEHEGQGGNQERVSGCVASPQRGLLVLDRATARSDTGRLHGRSGH